jgi:hypothetical protein
MTPVHRIISICFIALFPMLHSLNATANEGCPGNEVPLCHGFRPEDCTCVMLAPQVNSEQALGQSPAQSLTEVPVTVCETDDNDATAKLEYEADEAGQMKALLMGHQGGSVLDDQVAVPSDGGQPFMTAHGKCQLSK